jgi:hypothetical protein
MACDRSLACMPCLRFYIANLKYLDISRRWWPGLPDGIFSNQKSRFGLILEGLAIDDVGILYGHSVFYGYWYILRPFGTFYG